MHPFDPSGGGFHHGAPPFAPFLGGLMFLLFLILVATTVAFLLKRGHVGPPPWARHASPEREARSILAERFARGEIDGDEFMERASVLNWTPGVEPLPQPHQKHRRR
jgi:putative membrane protein